MAASAWGISDSVISMTEWGGGSNGNDALVDDISAPVLEVGDADVEREPQLSNHVDILFGFGGQVRGARCHTWCVKSRGRWDYSVGTTSRALWTSTQNTWPQQPSSTSPPISFRNTRFCGPHRISTAGVALHLTPKQAHVHYELHSDALIAEQIREEIPVRTTVFPQHRTSVPRPRHERHLLQAFRVLVNHLTDVLHHCFVETSCTPLDTMISAQRMAVTPVQEVCCTVSGTAHKKTRRKKRWTEYVYENENLKKRKRSE